MPQIKHSWVWVVSIWALARCARSCSNGYNPNSTVLYLRHLSTVWNNLFLKQRRLNVDATSWCCIDVEPTLYKRHVPAGLQHSLIHFCPWMRNFTAIKWNIFLCKSDINLKLHLISFSQSQHLLSIDFGFPILIAVSSLRPHPPPIDMNGWGISSCLNKQLVWTNYKVNQK